jgi:hypothetical protein
VSRCRPQMGRECQLRFIARTLREECPTVVAFVALAFMPRPSPNPERLMALTVNALPSFGAKKIGAPAWGREPRKARFNASFTPARGVIHPIAQFSTYLWSYRNPP